MIRLFIILCALSFSVMASSQTSGGQIRRTPKITSQPSSSNNKPIKNNKRINSHAASSAYAIRPISKSSLAKYNVVGGIYSVYANAQKRCKELRDEGYTANIVHDTNRNTYQVVIGSFNDEQDAINLRNHTYQKYYSYIICVTNDSIWVYRDNNSITSTSQPNSNNADTQSIAQRIISNMVFVQGGELTITQISDNRLVKTTVPSFYIGRYEVTQEEWKAIMKNNPSIQISNKTSINNVSWNDCQEFIRRLNSLTGKSFRLPTDAEWEFAARGGNNSKGYKYSGSDNINDVAWYNGNSNNKLHEVGLKAPNELGIYDMTGNVNEWCQDKINNAQVNLLRYSPGYSCIIRGGCWLSGGNECYVSNRIFASPELRDVGLGFRLAL